MTELTVYAIAQEATNVRALLGAACRAVSVDVRLELFGSGALFQRLRTRRTPPPPDLILWLGPYAAQAAALEELLQPYQPSSLPGAAAHAADWRWTAVDFLPFRVTGATAVASLDDLATVPRLAIADPDISELGMMSAIAVLDHTRQRARNLEEGWQWWQRRIAAGLEVAGDDNHALELVRQGRASHALTLRGSGAAFTGLAPVPQAIALAAGTQNLAAARVVFDWLASPEASSGDALSAWQAQANGLQALFDAAAPLDVDWATSQYTSIRRHWAAIFGGSAPAAATVLAT